MQMGAWFLVGALLITVWTDGVSRLFLIGVGIGVSIAGLLQSSIGPLQRWNQRRWLRSYEKRWAKKKMDAPEGSPSAK